MPIAFVIETQVEDHELYRQVLMQLYDLFYKLEAAELEATERKAANPEATKEDEIIKY